MSSIPGTPKYSVGGAVSYVDHHRRLQIGRVERIEAHWADRTRKPLIVYSVTHPTYRNNRAYVSEADIRCSVRVAQEGAE